MKNMETNQQVSHFINVATAKKMVSSYRQQVEKILLPAYAGRNILCNSETFSLNAIQVLLQQKGCDGLRIYYGMKEDDTIHYTRHFSSF
jgi:hypothetical protein